MSAGRVAALSAAVTITKPIKVRASTHRRNQRRDERLTGLHNASRSSEDVGKDGEKRILSELSGLLALEVPHVRQVAAALSAAVTITKPIKDAPNSQAEPTKKKGTPPTPSALRKRGSGGEALLSEKRPLPQNLLPSPSLCFCYLRLEALGFGPLLGVGAFNDGELELVGAAVKGVVANGGQTCGQRYRRQLGAVEERVLLNGGHALGEYNALQRGAAAERALANARQFGVLRNRYLAQLLTLLKGVGLNRRDRLGDGDLLQASGTA